MHSQKVLFLKVERAFTFPLVAVIQVPAGSQEGDGKLPSKA
jgi:hypothetical protein